VKKTTQLRKLIFGPELGIIMEAHNGITAKIVEQTGFKAIWGSGLTLSASLGVRDNNEASWTQILDLVEFMSDCTSIPILLDGDTGYGNFNNVRRLVKKLEQIDIAGVCIEDKLFPKTNSFIDGEKQRLADVAEFCGRIKAGKDAQKDKDFIIVARTEALIAGWGIDEALKRAAAYSKAGADAIVIHSKKNTADEVLEFRKIWNKKNVPVIIIPTKYPDIPLEVYQRAQINAVIWANHTLRSSITAVKRDLAELLKRKDLATLHKKIIPVKDIFHIQDVKELQVAEKKYLPQTTLKTKGIILAASKGKNFGSLTDDKPKCMIQIHGKPILSHIVETFNHCGIKDISVVVGYKGEAINLPNLNYVAGKDYNRSGILRSTANERRHHSSCG
jgi:phosphoenolpyruvate phosphomutase